VTTHRNVFGVFFWFLMPLGPACAVMYRVAEYLARAWNEPEHMRNEAFGQFAARAFYWIDWLPVRLTAVAFAVVGNFEDAIYAWRNFAHRWADEARGIILSAGGGAMGVRLGTPERKRLRRAAAGRRHGRLHRQRSRSHAWRRAERARIAKHRRAGVARLAVMDDAVVAVVRRGLAGLGHRTAQGGAPKIGLLKSSIRYNTAGARCLHRAHSRSIESEQAAQWPSPRNQDEAR
jgi:hypothetical protein